jgi:hypothetical protein
MTVEQQECFVIYVDEYGDGEKVLTAAVFDEQEAASYVNEYNKVYGPIMEYERVVCGAPEIPQPYIEYAFLFSIDLSNARLDARTVLQEPREDFSRYMCKYDPLAKKVTELTDIYIRFTCSDGDAEARRMAEKMARDFVAKNKPPRVVRNDK